MIMAGYVLTVSLSSHVHAPQVLSVPPATLVRFFFLFVNYILCKSQSWSLPLCLSVVATLMTSLFSSTYVGHQPLSLNVVIPKPVPSAMSVNRVLFGIYRSRSLPLSHALYHVQASQASWWNGATI